MTRTDSTNLFEPKYSFSNISFEDQDAMEPPAEGFAMLEFPTGFHKDPFEGMGVVWPLRFIFETFIEVDGNTDVTICDDDLISRVGDSIRLPKVLYDERYGFRRSFNEIDRHLRMRNTTDHRQ